MTSSQPADQAVSWSLDARGVATVTLNRPAVNNAYNADLVNGVTGAMDALGRESGLRVVLLRGAGRHFQAGADLEWLRAVSLQPHAENVAASRATAEAVWRLNALPVPTVALVQGACVGGGTGIVAACDVVVAAENAFFAISETRWGLVASIIIPQLADAIGARQVRRYALTGERFGAAEARRIGLVHEVVPPAELEATGERIVDQLLQNAPEANAQTKATTLGCAWAAHNAGDFERLIEQHAAKRRSAEAAEGFESFRGKRPAAWYTGPSR
ncbi:MAG: enoyl-CoA hydratase/isomerase family protein [Burkholderiales bacterium]|nr:enoyl-CoA hydratase/isomerase family protein [Burkholderiales bacterium]